MYDLVIAPAFYQQQEDCATITSSILKPNLSNSVLVGDNITIQEQPKKVRFADTVEETVQTIPIVENPVVDISAVVIVIAPNEPPLSLYAVETPLAADEKFAVSPAPLTMQEQLDAMPWKHKFGIKLCYAALFSAPFLLVAAVQPWNG